MLGPVPDKSNRPRAYEEVARTAALQPVRYQWNFSLIPFNILDGASVQPNPFRKRAIYVVHGVGAHLLTDTSTNLRHDLERVIDDIEPRHWRAKDTDHQWILPVPFVYDGYWGDYDNYERFHPELYKRQSDRERRFFTQLWRRRFKNLLLTSRWLSRRGWPLIRRGSLRFGFHYLFLGLLLQVFVFIGSIRSSYRKRITRTVGDARLYLDAENDTERAIVHFIDRRVGEKFLELLGLDWDLEELSVDQQLKVAGEPHRFEEVVWVAHSLGSVISFNVISDLLHQCLRCRARSPQAARNAERVERGLRQFVTIGSPLDKIWILFNEGRKHTPPSNPVLRPWPVEYLPGGKHDLWMAAGERPFWKNYFYILDPVSGPLEERFQPGVDGPRPRIVNRHTKGWRRPVLCHMSYFRDPQFLIDLLAEAYAPYCKSFVPRTWSLRTCKLRLNAVVIFFYLWLLWVVWRVSPFIGDALMRCWAGRHELLHWVGRVLAH